MKASTTTTTTNIKPKPAARTGKQAKPAARRGKAKRPSRKVVQISSSEGEGEEEYEDEDENGEEDEGEEGNTPRARPGRGAKRKARQKWQTSVAKQPSQQQPNKTTLTYTHNSGNVVERKHVSRYYLVHL